MNSLKSRLFSISLVALLVVACSEVPAPTEAGAVSRAPTSLEAAESLPAPPRETPETAALSEPVSVTDPAAAPAAEPIPPAGEPPLLVAAVDPEKTGSAAVPAVLAAAAAAPAAAAPSWESDYAVLLKKYAGSSGVAYKKWHGNRADVAVLNSVTDRIAAANLSGKSSREKLAFYLNAYNAWILKRILDDYPVKGPGNGSAIKRGYFFKSKSITVAGKEMSFSSLENDIIRPGYKEPRIHFALNCASLSCPPLHDRAFDAASLDATLTSLTRAFVNRNPLGFQVSGVKARVSKIFDWYAEDFKGAGGVLAYVNQYRDTPVSPKLKIEFMEYDWSLNEAP